MKTCFFLLARIIAGLVLISLHSYAQSTYEPYTFNTFAGRANSSGGADGTGSAARFNQPFSVAVDGVGNVYVADTYAHTIRRVTPSGLVRTLAGRGGISGSADGTGDAARFNMPSGVAVDSIGNLYVSDGANTIRELRPVGTNWVVATIAGKPGASGSVDGTNNAARFNTPGMVAVDKAGNLYVADYLNDTIRKVTPVGTNWVVTTIAGKPGTAGSTDGTGNAARFNNPGGVAVDTAGNLYVSETGNTIRKVTPVGTNWVVTTIAGKSGTAGSTDGIGSAARFNSPSNVALDSAGNIFVTESLNQIIRKVTQIGSNWVVTTLAGRVGSVGSSDGNGSAARFSYPQGCAVDSAGNLYVADSGNSTIRRGYPLLEITSFGPSFGFNNGQFSFDLTGPTGKWVVVEASADLVNWLPLSTNTLTGPLNPLNFNDPQSATIFQRFYRMHIE